MLFQLQVIVGPTALYKPRFQGSIKRPV